MFKKSFLLAAMSLAIFSACNKSETTPASAVSEELGLVMKGGGSGSVTCPPNIQYCGNTKTVDLIAGQHTVAGTVTIGNDENNLYVTYTTTGGWKMTELHLFANDCCLFPMANGSASSAPGQYPNAVTFSGSGVSSYTFTIPMSSLQWCVTDICVAAHAVVKSKTATETAWGKGECINTSNWAMRFSYCIQSCD